MLQTTAESRDVRARHRSDTEHAQEWLSAFADALRAADRAELEAPFIEDSHWRDLLAFTWTVMPSDSSGASSPRCCGNSHGSRRAASRSQQAMCRRDG